MKKQEEYLLDQIMHRPLLLRIGRGVKVEGRRSKWRGKSQTRGKFSERFKCYHCGKEGHIKRFFMLSRGNKGRTKDKQQSEER